MVRVGGVGPFGGMKLFRAVGRGRRSGGLVVGGQFRGEPQRLPARGNAPRVRFLGRRVRGIRLLLAVRCERVLQRTPSVGHLGLRVLRRRAGLDGGRGVVQRAKLAERGLDGVGLGRVRRMVGRRLGSSGGGVLVLRGALDQACLPEDRVGRKLLAPRRRRLGGCVSRPLRVGGDLRIGCGGLRVGRGGVPRDRRGVPALLWLCGRCCPLGGRGGRRGCGGFGVGIGLGGALFLGAPVARLPEGGIAVTLGGGGLGGGGGRCIPGGLLRGSRGRLGWCAIPARLPGGSGGRVPRRRCIRRRCIPLGSGRRGFGRGSAPLGLCGRMVWCSNPLGRRGRSLGGGSAPFRSGRRRRRCVLAPGRASRGLSISAGEPRQVEIEPRAAVTQVDRPLIERRGGDRLEPLQHRVFLRRRGNGGVAPGRQRLEIRKACGLRHRLLRELLAREVRRLERHRPEILRLDLLERLRREIALGQRRNRRRDVPALPRGFGAGFLRLRERRGRELRRRLARRLRPLPGRGRRPEIAQRRPCDRGLVRGRRRDRPLPAEGLRGQRHDPSVGAGLRRGLGLGRSAGGRWLWPRRRDPIGKRRARRRLAGDDRWLSRVVVLVDGGDDLAGAGEDGLDALAGVERELIDGRKVGRIAHRDGHDLAASGAADVEGEDLKLLGQALRDHLHRACIDLGLAQLHRGHPDVLAEDADHLVLADEPLLHEDRAELAAPLLLVAERALELVLIDRLQLEKQLTESLARRHPVTP